MSNEMIDEIMGQIGRHGYDCMRHDSDAASASFESLRTQIAAALASQAQQMAELRGMLDEHKKECEACFAIAQRLDAGNSAMPGSFTGAPSERIARQVDALTTSLALASGCLYRAGWEYIADAIHGPVWKPPVNRVAAELRVRLAEKEAEIEAEIEALTAERDKHNAELMAMLAAERQVSAGYVALRVILGAMSPPSTEWPDLSEYVTETARAVVAERDELRKRLDDAKPATPAPGEWIEWLGGECPIADGVLFSAKFRDGTITNKYRHATVYRWSHVGVPEADIVAYRILP